jgi:hypothetical protein
LEHASLSKDKHAPVAAAVVVVCNNILEEEHLMLPNILSEILVQLMVCIDFAWIQKEHPCHGRDGRLLAAGVPGWK